jgi:single-strand DNA-binding protein
VSNTTNLVVLVGHVGRDPEVRAFPDGTPVANFTLATESSWKDKQDQWQERTEWHRISAVGNIALRVERAVKKGTQVHVVGELRYQKWVDKETKEDRYAAEIRAHELVVGRGGIDSAKEHGGGDELASPAPAASKSKNANS